MNNTDENPSIHPSVFIGKIPKKVAIWFGICQFFWLGFPLVFFIGVQTGIIPEIPIGYDTSWATSVDQGDAIDESTFETSRFMVGITATLLWISLFSVSISFCCLGLLVSYASRRAFGDDPESYGSIAFSMLFLGAVFGTLLVLIFLGGFVAGTLFPDLSQAGFRRLYHVVSSPETWAKLMVWAFIAGFVERMIPDTLENLASRFEPEDIESIANIEPALRETDKIDLPESRPPNR